MSNPRTSLSIGPLLLIAALASREAFAVPPRPATPLPAKANAAASPGAWLGARKDFPGFVEHIAAAGSDVYLGTRAGLLRSSDGGLHWQPVAAAPDVNALWGRSPEEVYIANATVMSRSVDHGQTWQPIATPATTGIVHIWGSSGSELYAIAHVKGKPTVLYSEDAGKTVVTLDLGVKQGYLKAIGGAGLNEVVVGGTVVVGTDTRPLLYRSVDKGKAWKKLPLPAEKDLSSVNGVCFSDSGVLFIATSYSVFASKDHGAHWKRSTTTSEKELLALACKGSEVFAGGRGPTFLHSADEGKTWTTNELDQYLAGMPGETDAIAVTANGEVYVGGVASFNPSAGSLYRRSAPGAQGKPSSSAKYPGTDAGARQLLTDIRTGDAKALSAALKPNANDYAAVFNDEFAPKAQKAYEALWAAAPAVITADDTQTELIVSKATRDDLVNWTPRAEADFPGGYKKVARFFKPGITVYRWKYTKSADSLGMAYDGLVFVNDHWAWFPKPWKLKD